MGNKTLIAIGHKSPSMFMIYYKKRYSQKVYGVNSRNYPQKVHKWGCTTKKARRYKQVTESDGKARHE